MNENCLYCQKPLNYWRRLTRQLYCSEAHREKYISAYTELATSELARRASDTDTSEGPNSSLADMMAEVECDRHFFQEILDRTPVGIAVVAEDLMVQYANQAVRESLKIDVEESREVRLSDLVGGENIAPIVETVFATEEPVADLLLANDDETLSIRVTVQTLGVWKEDVQRVVLVMIDDVTEFLTATKDRNPAPVQATSS